MAQNTLDGEIKNLYDNLMEEANTLRKIQRSLREPNQLSNLNHQKKRLDSKIKTYRKAVIDLRESFYDRYLHYGEDLRKLESSSLLGQPLEFYPNWPKVYEGANYKFGWIQSDGFRIQTEESIDYVGFWQLYRNLLLHDNRLDLWPDYFGHSSNSGNFINEQVKILQELRFPLSGANLDGAIAVDLETTSLSPASGEIIELGIVEINGNDPREWPRESIRFGLSGKKSELLGTGPKHIHGIELEDIADLPSIDNLSHQKYLQSKLCVGKRLVVHNGSFEFKWLSQYVDGFFEANTDQFGMQTIIDTAVMSKFAFQAPISETKIKDNRLKTVVEACGLTYTDGHSAQADASMAAIVAHKMLEPFNSSHVKLQELSQNDYFEVLRKPLKK